MKPHKRSKPLSSATDQERLDGAWADRVVQRVQGGLRGVLDACPAQAKTATGMARLLDLRVPLCHRVLRGARMRGSAVEVIAVLPGVDGLRIVLDALSRAGIAEKLLSKATSAVQELDDLVAHAGGSQRRLIDALRVENTTTENEGDVPAAQRARIAAFTHLSQTLGTSSQGLIGMRIYHPPNEPRAADDLDMIALLGRVGFARSSAALPLALSVAIDGRESSAEDGRTFLIEQFCTPPLPSVTLEASGKATLAIVDAKHERNSPIDVFAGPFRATHAFAREGHTPHLCSAISCNSPARWLAQDIFLPRDWAPNLRCEAGVYVYGALGVMSGDPSKRWFERLPVSVTPGLLGRGITNVAFERYPRQIELAKWLFATAKLNPDDYIGYRMEVLYPIMFAQHVLHCTPDNQ